MSAFGGKADMGGTLIELPRRPRQRVKTSTNKKPRPAVGKNIKGRVLAGLPERDQLVAVLLPVSTHFVADEIRHVGAFAVAVSRIAAHRIEDLAGQQLVALVRPKLRRERGCAFHQNFIRSVFSSR